MITEGHLVRHYQGRKGGRGPAIIDIAQDHLLFHLAQSGIFELGIALKGGTAVRKFRAGNAGRFSTDLDFAGVDDASAELLLEVVDGAKVGPFAFAMPASTRCPKGGTYTEASIAARTQPTSGGPQMDHYLHRLHDPETVYGLVRDVFLGASITCFLYALHRIASALKLSARVKALDEFEDSYAPEEREILIEKIRVTSLHY